jgi:hypothetical protein
MRASKYDLRRPRLPAPSAPLGLGLLGFLFLGCGGHSAHVSEQDGGVAESDGESEATSVADGATPDACGEVFDAESVDPSTACLGTENVFVIEGSDPYVYCGPPLTIAGGSGWSESGDPYEQYGSPAQVGITTPEGWTATFWSAGQDPPPLAVGTYTVSPDGNPEGPALHISEYGGCGIRREPSPFSTSPPFRPARRTF